MRLKTIMENEITFDGTVVEEVRKKREAVFIVSHHRPKP
jgi:hypothetical protein